MANALVATFIHGTISISCRCAVPNNLEGPADRTLYLGYSFYNIDNPDFHHNYYTFQDVIGKNKLR